MQQFIGFHVSSSDYMIPILKVREIITMPSVTALPHLPPYVKGITNLRGNIIPVVNLRNLLDSSGGDGEGNTVIVLATGKITFGIVVDGIAGVVNADESDIEPPEGFFNNNVDNIEGVAKLNDKLIILLDIKKLLPLDDMSLLEDAIVDVRETDDGDSVEISREIDTCGGKVTVTELCDAREYFSDKIEKDDPKRNIYDLMISFMDALGAGEFFKIEGIIEQLVKETDSDLFKEVGKITRNLHNSLDEFKGAIDNGIQKIAADDVPKAVDKLEFVMKKTEDAANKTMGIVESYFEESSDFSKHVESIKGFDESVNYLNMFKESLDDDMTSILTAQQFQDITGQTIKKVISLVSEVETELLNLIKKFGMPVKAESTNTENTGELEASENKVETEQVWSGSEEKSGEQVSQSDVESLLNDFGF